MEPARELELARDRRFVALRQVCEEAVATGVVPGMVVLCADAGQVLFHEAFGCAEVEPDARPATPQTIYDVASLTKAVVTSVLVMRAVAAGRLDLDAPIERLLPEFRGAGKSSVTARLLLCHASGLPAHRPFYLGAPAGPAAREFVLRAAAEEPLVEAPGARSLYSDVGFILLGGALERASGLRLDVLAGRAIFEPLGLRATGFVDLGDKTARDRLRGAGPVAATESCVARGRMLVGEVHDRNAAAMGGIAGHAGLFSTASDLAAISGALCGAWAAPGAGAIVDHEVIAEFWRPCGIVGSTWRLGWDGPAPVSSQAGHRLSRGAVGHLGFTGCSLWIDPPRARFIVTLANRVHPTVRDDPRFRALRPAVQDAAVAAMEDDWPHAHARPRP